LCLADARRKTIEVLTSETESVQYFDIRDRRHHVYTAIKNADRNKLLEKVKVERNAPVRVVTGPDLTKILFPDTQFARQHTGVGYLWAVIDGKRFQVKNEGTPLVVGQEYFGFTLSPNGQTFATVMKPS